MNSKKIYRTAQKETVLDYLKSSNGEHLTVKDIYEHLKANNEKIGLTTVYRHLESLVKDGTVVKSIIDENTPACYEYADCDHSQCYHCKCIRCGKLIHLHCDEISSLENHISNDHHFTIVPKMTVFYGICEDCMAKENAL